MSAATFFMLLVFGVVLYAAWRTFREDPPEAMPLGAAKKAAASKPLSDIAADKPSPGPVGINVGATISDNVMKIIELDRSFAPQEFLSAARDNFKKILEAFEADKIAEVEELMSAKIAAHLKANRKALAKESKTPKTEIIRIKRVSIKEATSLKSTRRAEIDVLFETEQTAVILGKDGKVSEGDENQILFISDLWTFSRDLKSRDPWLLTAIKTAPAPAATDKESEGKK